MNGHFLIRVEDTWEPVVQDSESVELGRMLLEASALQLGAEIERKRDGRKTIVDVVLLVGDHQENTH
jgi:hypothetical protein